MNGKIKLLISFVIGLIIGLGLMFVIKLDERQLNYVKALYQGPAGELLIYQDEKSKDYLFDYFPVGRVPFEINENLKEDKVNESYSVDVMVVVDGKNYVLGNYLADNKGEVPRLQGEFPQAAVEEYTSLNGDPSNIISLNLEVKETLKYYDQIQSTLKEFS